VRRDDHEAPAPSGPSAASSASRPLVFAHRGGAALAPENTLAAFERAAALPVDGFELDVRLSKDGVPVVVHDAHLARTTDRSASVASLTAAELARVDAGFHCFPETGYPFRGRGIGVPTLAEVLDRFPDLHIIVELKGSDPRLALAVVDAIREVGALDRVTVGGFSLRALQAVRAYDPRVRTGAAKEETRLALYRSWIRWPGRGAYRTFLVPERSGRTRIVSPRFLSSAHRLGLPVYVWTVNDPGDMHRLLSWGVDALISDRPDLAVAAVGRPFSA
jgi:glycerophosphoryl diester phosphodiesterase